MQDTRRDQVGSVSWRDFLRTNEPFPSSGLGTFLTFDVIPGQKRDHLREVMRRSWEAGGRVDCPALVSEQLKALPLF